MIARDAMRPRIERRLAVHEKAVAMVSVGERQVDLPRAVGLAVHRVRRGMPTVEIARDKNFLRIQSAANKIHRLGHVLGGITGFGNVKWEVQTVHYNSYRFQNGVYLMVSRLAIVKEAHPESARNLSCRFTKLS